MEEPEFKWGKKWMGIVFAILLIISRPSPCTVLDGFIYFSLIHFAFFVIYDLHYLYSKYWHESQNYRSLLRDAKEDISRKTSEICHAAALLYLKGSEGYFFYDEEKKILYSGGNGLDFQCFHVEEFIDYYKMHKTSNPDAITRWGKFYTWWQIRNNLVSKEDWKDRCNDVVVDIDTCIQLRRFYKVIKKVGNVFNGRPFPSSTLVCIVGNDYSDYEYKCYMRYEELTLVYKSFTILRESSFSLAYIKGLDSFVFEGDGFLRDRSRVMVRNIEPTLTNDEKKNAILIYGEI